MLWLHDRPGLLDSKGGLNAAGSSPLGWIHRFHSWDAGARSQGASARSPEIKIREALLWTFFWIAISLIFNVGVFIFAGSEKGLEFLTGYLIEKSLSVDNIFVFILIFSYFKIPARYQHKVLFWGILGALVMRAAFIFAGVALLSRLHWVIYIFGAFLVFIGIRMAFEKDKEVHPERNPVLLLFKRFLPLAPDDGSDRFFAERGGACLPHPSSSCSSSSRQRTSSSRSTPSPRYFR